jgi:hypothetical protein
VDAGAWTRMVLPAGERADAFVAQIYHQWFQVRVGCLYRRRDATIVSLISLLKFSIIASQVVTQSTPEMIRAN